MRATTHDCVRQRGACNRITIDITGDAGLKGETQPGIDSLLMADESSTAAIDLEQSAIHFVKERRRRPLGRHPHAIVVACRQAGTPLGLHLP